jgi:hypothetical protein
MGPNHLLWATPCDNEHPAGSIELIEPDLIRGYVVFDLDRAPGTPQPPAPWVEVCEAAYMIWNNAPASEPASAPNQTSTSAAVTALSAMDILRQTAAAQPLQAIVSPDRTGASFMQRLWKRLRISRSHNSDDYDAAGQRRLSGQILQVTR